MSPLRDLLQENLQKSPPQIADEKELLYGFRSNEWKKKTRERVEKLTGKALRKRTAELEAELQKLALFRRVTEEEERQRGLTEVLSKAYASIGARESQIHFELEVLNEQEKIDRRFKTLRASENKLKHREPVGPTEKRVYAALKKARGGFVPLKDDKSRRAVHRLRRRGHDIEIGKPFDKVGYRLVK